MGNYLLDRLPFRVSDGAMDCGALGGTVCISQLGGDLELGGILGDASLFDVNTGEA